MSSNSSLSVWSLPELPLKLPFLLLPELSDCGDAFALVDLVAQMSRPPNLTLRSRCIA
eukprot:CAMPEP_0179181494 /NCGR_PEP_ID=MMETSP0796-20121207/89890_1 /TAXON_ID=73915 /ORGANISM="Pyrodinium bahamense, Strain pbaha01" /LENGTH=57 /DNA_ID=CAMNT_0020885269 /DNA_START=119 /DNA_END=289 /DNA_ORIENTATION=+